jgi:beta-glucosidase
MLSSGKREAGSGKRKAGSGKRAFVTLVLLGACHQIPSAELSHGAGVRQRGTSQGSSLPASHVPPAAQEARFVDSVLALMTLEEKLGQLMQYSGYQAVTGPGEPVAGDAQIRNSQVGSFLNVHGAANTRRLQRMAMEETRLKIPLVFAHDVIHGFRTIFPVPLAEAASWDPSAAERSARIAAIEATAHGLHWTFAPMVDVARDPRWGRIVEGAGEDPLLGSAMAAARVRGFQGTDLSANNTMAATAKHFAAYGAAEGGRDYNIVEVSEQTLKEVYLPPFFAAVAAGAQTVMASFNEVNGIPMHANQRLLNDVLRGEWKFNGLVVSDWGGIQELLAHGVAPTREDAGVLAMKAGVDVDMVSAVYPTELPRALARGRVTRGEIDEAVRRVLRLKYRLGLFEDPYRYSDTTRQRTLTLAPEHLAAAREIGRKSIVLLKNERRVLPLAKTVGTIAVIGPLADDRRSVLGSWHAAGRPDESVTILAGIRAAVSPRTRVLYAKGVPADTMNTAGIPEAVAAARQADVVVLVLGEREEMSGEAASRAWIDLPGAQEALARAVHATGKPTVAVLANGRPLSIVWLAAEVPAILETWFLGTQMGHAVADVLFGDYNPGGKLPVTFPRTTGQIPIYYNHKNTGRPPAQQNKYTSKYLDVPWTPLFPFGHGLSYTTFAYDNLRLSAPTMRMSDTLVVTVDVTNSGDRAGDEVVQLYVQDEVASVTRPLKELKGFSRVTLQPGERRTVTFRLRADDLAFYDAAVRRVTEPGFFKVFVGTSSASVREARFELLGPGR